MIIAPDMTAKTIYQTVKTEGFVGLKCYHTMATGCERTWTAPIETYLPEPQVAVAGELGLAITLHLVRDRALADPLNQATIRRYCERYLDMRLLLAHAGRGFNPWHTIEGIHSRRAFGTYQSRRRPGGSFRGQLARRWTSGTGLLPRRHR